MFSGKFENQVAKEYKICYTTSNMFNKMEGVGMYYDL